MSNAAGDGRLSGKLGPSPGMGRGGWPSLLPWWHLDVCLAGVSACSPLGDQLAKFDDVLDEPARFGVVEVQQLQRLEDKGGVDTLPLRVSECLISEQEGA